MTGVTSYALAIHTFASLSTKVALLKHVVRQFASVSFGVSCFSTQIENCRLTPSDNCCANQDGIVRRGCLMFHHLMLLVVNYSVLFMVLFLRKWYADSSCLIM